MSCLVAHVYPPLPRISLRHWFPPSVRSLDVGFRDSCFRAIQYSSHQGQSCMRYILDCRRINTLLCVRRSLSRTIAMSSGSGKKHRTTLRSHDCRARRRIAPKHCLKGAEGPVVSTQVNLLCKAITFRASTVLPLAPRMP